MIWYVSSKQGSDTHDGSSTLTAFKTLSHAVAAAKAARIDTSSAPVPEAKDTAEDLAYLCP